MVVDDAWQHETARSINRHVDRCFGLFCARNNPCYLFSVNQDGSIKGLAFVDDGSSLDERPHGLGALVSGECSESVASTLGAAGATGGCWAAVSAASSTSPF